jgi:hypothetical protein
VLDAEIACAAQHVEQAGICKSFNLRRLGQATPVKAV